jgi:hypothetical protein
MDKQTRGKKVGCLWVRGRQDRLRLMDRGRMEAGQAEANGQG